MIIAVFGWIFGISAQYFCARASMLFGREIRNALYDKILKMDMKTIDRFTIPSLITRTTSDVNRVQTGLNLMLRLMLRIPFVVAGAIIMSGIINLKIMLIFIALVPLIAVVTTFAVKKSMPFYERIQKITDNIGTFCRENILGVKSVRAFGMQKKESADFQKKAEELYDNQVKAEYYNSAVTPFNTLLINVSIVIILLLGSVFVSNKELMSGDIIAFVSYLSVILVSVERTCTLIISFNKAQTSSVRVAEVLEYKKDDNDISEESHAENESVISFDNVTFCYESKSKPAIQDISFSVSKGESLGIIGGTGSGKSTVLNLL